MKTIALGFAFAVLAAAATPAWAQLQRADLQINKADSPDPVATGGMLTYTLTVRNAGPASALGVQVVDQLPAGATFVSVTPTASCMHTPANNRVTCLLGTVLSGGGGVITIVVTAPATPGTLNNTALVGSMTNDPNQMNNFDTESTTVAAASAADLAVVKRDSPDPVVQNGTLTYTVVASNNGPAAATGVMVTDTLPANFTFATATSTAGACTQAAGTVTCTVGNLASGASATITITGTATTVGTLNNMAQIAGAQTDPVAANNADSEPTQVVSATSADLQISKTDSADPVVAGQNLTYTVTVRNAGPAGATGVSVTDMLPAGVTFVSATPTQGACTQATGTVTCPLGALAAGATATIAIVVTTGGAGFLQNLASVTATETDPSPLNNQARQTTQVIAAASADLALTKVDTPDPVATGGTLTYTLTVTNNGPGGATNLMLTDNLPAGLASPTATTVGGTCSTAGNMVTCMRAALASAATWTITLTGTAPTTAGSLTNTAFVRGAEMDPTPGNNAAMATTNVAAPSSADISVQKSDSPDPVAPGGVLTYTVTVSNAGPSGASNVMLSDNLPPGVTFNSATASQGSCTQASGNVTCSLGSIAAAGSATATIMVTTGGAGTLTNSARAGAAETDPNTANNVATQSTTVAVATSADMRITKTDSRDPAVVGDTLTYTLTASNAGPGGATNVVVTDNLPSGVSFVSATPSQGTCSEAGGVVSCAIGALANGASATVAVVVNPTSAGNLINSAGVAAAEADSNPANNSAMESTTVTAVGAIADLSLTKSGTATGSNAVTFTLTVSNAGPQAASNVAVSDVLPGAVSFVSATASQGSCSETGGTVQCALGTLASAASATVTIQVTTSVTGAISNTATTSAAETDPNSANNTASSTTTLIGPDDGGVGSDGAGSDGGGLNDGSSQQEGVSDGGEDGCGCRTGGRADFGGLWGVLVLLGAALVLRRRRGR